MPLGKSQEPVSKKKPDPLADILNMTDRMVLAADQSDWDTVGDLESERKRLIQSLFCDPLPASLMPDLAGGIRKVLEANKEIAALGGESRQKLAGELQQLNQRRKAQQAYSGD
jgi:hypothetical protein